MEFYEKKTIIYVYYKKKICSYVRLGLEGGGG